MAISNQKFQVSGIFAVMLAIADSKNGVLSHSQGSLASATHVSDC